MIENNPVALYVLLAYLTVFGSGDNN